jgi:hypothetical protein
MSRFVFIVQRRSRESASLSDMIRVFIPGAAVRQREEDTRRRIV